MRVVCHWVREKVEAKDRRGDVHLGEAWGWSESDLEEARSRARAAAERVAQWLAGGHKGAEPSRSWQYSYRLDRPPREEIVQVLQDATGQTSALITRNGYGALVLNTRALMFVDIDFPKPSTTAGLLKRLFGKVPPPVDIEAQAIERVRSWCAANADYGVRIYRTAAGLRVAIVDRPMGPKADDARRILEELGSDPLYRRLCEVQECFRARLTPKPWRMKGVVDVGPPPAEFPFEEPAAEQLYRDWQAEYDKAAMQFATCRLAESHGPPSVHPELESLLKLHDSLTRVDSTLELA